jgi:hypothetical protein
MGKAFDPAPRDKHAVDPQEAARLDSETSHDLNAGLIGTFPASDPVSATIPPPSKEPRAGLFGWIRSLLN